MFIDVTIIGTSPLMLDRFGEEMLETGPKSTNKTNNETPKEQAIRKIYADHEGNPVFPVDNLMSCVIDAGRFIKIGRRQLSTRDETIVTGFLSIEGSFLPIRSKDGWRVDSRGIVNQATKGRHICHRPIFDDWEFDFVLNIDETEVRADTVRELIDRAGKQIGLGVMRPSRKGRYGQFKVKCWDCRAAKKAKAA